MVGGHWILWIQWIVCVINFRRRKNILHLLNRHFERANYDVTLWSKQKSLLTHHRVCQSTIQPLLRFVFALPPPCTASLASCWRQRRSWRRAAEPRRSPPSPLSTQQNAAMLSGGRSKTLNKDEKIFEREKEKKEKFLILNSVSEKFAPMSIRRNVLTSRFQGGQTLQIFLPSVNLGEIRNCLSLLQFRKSSYV